MTPRVVRWVGRIVAILIVLMISVGTRVLISGHTDLRIARQAQEANLPSTAVDYYSRAARWYFPVGGAHVEAREALVRIAEDAEARQDLDFAVRVWRELRSAILATRWLYTPSAEMLGLANRQIAQGVSKMSVDQRDPLSDEKAHLVLLERTNMPSPIMAGLASILFVMWLVVTATGTWFSVSGEGKTRWSRFALTMAVSIACLVGWLVVLRYA